MSEPTPEHRLIVTDRLCLEDLADDAVISLRRLQPEEAAGIVAEHEGDPLFCVESSFTREDVEQIGLLRIGGRLIRAVLSAYLPIKSSDTILIVGREHGRLSFRQVSVELDQLILPALSAQGFESAELIA